MKRKSKACQDIPKRNPFCGLLKADLRKVGIEVQTYGLGPENELVYAGVHFVPELSARWIYRLHKHSAAWRNWYDNLPENKARDYPAKHSPQVVHCGFYPIDEPQSVRWLRLAV